MESPKAWITNIGSTKWSSFSKAHFLTSIDPRVELGMFLAVSYFLIYKLNPHQYLYSFIKNQHYRARHTLYMEEKIIKEDKAVSTSLLRSFSRWLIWQLRRLNFPKNSARFWIIEEKYACRIQGPGYTDTGLHEPAAQGISQWWHR